MRSVKSILGLVIVGLISTGTLKSQHIVNPIPELIQKSGLVVHLESFTTIPSGEGYSSARINMIRQLPDGSGRMVVIDLNGFLYIVDDQGGYSEYINFNTEFSGFKSSPGLGTGAGAVAVHPEFETNGVFYTSHSENSESGEADFTPNEGGTALQWVITRWVTSDPGADVFAGTHTEILRMDFPGTIHGTQDITFNPFAGEGDADYGILYICNGDGGSSENWLFANVGTIESYLSAILRIDPEGSNSTNGRYGIPSDNPWYDETGAVKELWAYGFRNPHRLSFEVKGEDTVLFVGDIGHHKIEEINLVEKGGNYGWDQREGTFIHDRTDPGRGILPLDGQDNVPYIYPVAQYDHGEGRAIALGHTWTSDIDSDLQGTLFFGDIPVGRLFHIPMDSLLQGRQYDIQEAKITINGGEVTTFPAYHNNGRVDLRFARNASGQIMMFTKINGRIYKCVGSTQPAPVAQFTVDNSAGHAPFSISPDPSGSTGVNLSYHWDFGDGSTSGDEFTEHTYEGPGLYHLSLVVNDGSQDSEVFSTEINVYSRPEASIVANVTEGEPPLTVLLDGRTSKTDDRGQAEYHWDFDDGEEANTGYVSHTFLSRGMHEVVLTVADGLGELDRDTLWINTAVVPLSLDKADVLAIYPNPAKNLVNVNVKQAAMILIEDLTGRELHRYQVSQGFNELDVSFLSEGVYIFHLLENGLSQAYKKIILKR